MFQYRFNNRRSLDVIECVFKIIKNIYILAGGFCELSLYYSILHLHKTTNLKYNLAPEILILQ